MSLAETFQLALRIAAETVPYWRGPAVVVFATVACVALYVWVDAS